MLTVNSFTEWQKAAIECLATNSFGVSTRLVHETVRDKRGFEISRASIIIFLDKLANLGIVNTEEQTGKGRKRFIYSLPAGLDIFYLESTMILFVQVIDQMPNVDHMNAFKRTLEQAGLSPLAKS